MNVLILTLSLALLWSPLGLAQTDPQVWLERGHEMARQGRTAEALAAFDRSKQHDPKDPRAYVYSGQALIAAGRLEDAQNELQQVPNLKITEPADALAYARAADGVGWPEGAIEALLPFRDHPGLPDEGLWLLADLHFRKRQPDQALAALDRFARRQPEDTRIDLLRGEIYLMKQDYPEARLYFGRAVRSRPDDAAAHYGLGKAIWLAEGTDESRRSLLRATSLDPSDAAILHTLAIVCLKFDDNDEAIGHLERAASLDDFPSQVLFQLGNAYRKIGDSARSREVLTRYQQRFSAEEAEKNRQTAVEQLVNQGQRQLDEGKVLAGLQSLQRVVQMEPDHWKAHSLLAKIYLSSDRMPQALTHIRRMLEIEPDNSEGSFLMAFYLHGGGENRRALDYALRSKDLLPGNPELRNLLGNIHLALGQRERAREEYRAAMNLVPENPAFRMNYESVSRNP